MGIKHSRLDKSRKDWWKSAVFYQIYPKSFQDSNHDGIGDLQGIISRLDYLDRLGIDGIWMSPMLQSPQVDNGYDISDYQAVDPLFGSMEDMEELIAAAKKRGISIILDLVLNHTSDRHRWFLEAKKDKTNPYHDYYVWRDGSPKQPPNDMRAAFGGSAWTYVPEIGQYYFHQFAIQQPDLNWNNPAVRRELYDMIRFWVDKGIEGFRLDVIDQIAKEPDLKITGNGPCLHEFLRELSAEGFREEYLVTVGEAWGADVDRAKQFSAPDGSELSMVFQFQHIGLDQQPGKEKWDLAPLSLPALKQCMLHWQNGLEGKGWNSLFMNNHDLPRIVSRWGNDRQYRIESAKMLGAVFHGMQGTPFVYQGEEIGMTNIRLSINEYEDVETVNLYRERMGWGYTHDEIMESIYARSRDNARTMMQWSGEKYAGFSDTKPWFAVNPNYTEINAEKALADENSVFYFYQKLIALRKELPVIRDGSFTLLCPEDGHIFAYIREDRNSRLLVVGSFGENCLLIPEDIQKQDTFQQGALILSNYAGPVDKGADLILRPYEIRYYLVHYNPYECD